MGSCRLCVVLPKQAFKNDKSNWEMPLDDEDSRQSVEVDVLRGGGEHQPY